MHGPGEPEPRDVALQQTLMKALDSGRCMIVTFWVEERPGEPTNKLHAQLHTRDFPQGDFNIALKMLQERLQEETDRLAKLNTSSSTTKEA